MASSHSKVRAWEGDHPSTDLYRVNMLEKHGTLKRTPRSAKRTRTRVCTMIVTVWLVASINQSKDLTVVFANLALLVCLVFGVSNVVEVGTAPFMHEQVHHCTLHRFTATPRLFVCCFRRMELMSTSVALTCCQPPLSLRREF